jgi:hypothetical protein
MPLLIAHTLGIDHYERTSYLTAFYWLKITDYFNEVWNNTQHFDNSWRLSSAKQSKIVAKISCLLFHYFYLLAMCRNGLCTILFCQIMNEKCLCMFQSLSVLPWDHNMPWDHKISSHHNTGPVCLDQKDELPHLCTLHLMVKFFMGLI